MSAAPPNFPPNWGAGFQAGILPPPPPPATMWDGGVRPPQHPLVAWPGGNERFHTPEYESRERVRDQQYQEIRDLLRRVPGMSLPPEKAAPGSYADSPFTDSITMVGMPKGFSAPTMALYDGTTDPLDHVSQYKQKMMVSPATGPLKEAGMCKGFGSTLSGAALQWFVSLPNKSIATFADLVNAFAQQFASSRKPEKQSSDMYRITQDFGETITEYMTRFNIEKVAIPGCDVTTAIQAFRRGLHRDSDLYKELTMHPCLPFDQVQTRAKAAMRLEEDHMYQRSIPSGGRIEIRRRRRSDQSLIAGR